MTEHVWLKSNVPDVLLKHIEPKATERKRRLFAVACCRRIQHLFMDDRSRRAVEIAEQFADGEVSEETLAAAWTDATEAADDIEAIGGGYAVLPEGMIPPVVMAADWRACYAAMDVAHIYIDCRRIPGDVASAAAYFVSPAPMDADYDLRYKQKQVPKKWKSVRKKELAACTSLLRDIFGNPFRPIRLDPAWLTPDVTALAQAIYDERRFSDLPILADALEEAGCTSDDILSHCRDGGEHARGCWVVDLLLGRS